ncbi:hypothetical protein [Cupriavidus sp. WS]
MRNHITSVLARLALENWLQAIVLARTVGFRDFLGRF